MSIVRQVNLQTAGALLDSLSPRGRWFKGQRRQWVFRGHSRSSYRLVPSALRAGAFEAFGGGSSYASERDQVGAERRFAEQFFLRADASGLPLSVDYQELEALFARARDDELRQLDVGLIAEWPPDPLLSLLGLAQHHGLPTRLLDWSYDPLTACYFAAEAASRETVVDRRGRLGIWALDVATVALERELRGASFPVARVTVPAGSNANLHAQSGLFTLVRRPRAGWRPDGPVDRTSLDEVLKEAWGSDGDAAPTVAYHFTLPVTEARLLLFHLAALGVDGSLLFPGFDGVVRALREEPRWQRS